MCMASVPHQYDYCVSEMVPVLEKLREDGKVRSTAISERFYVDPRHELLARALQDDYFDVMMVAVNLLNQSALRHVIPTARAKDIGIQAIYAVRGKLATRESAQQVINQAIENGEVDPRRPRSGPVGFSTRGRGSRLADRGLLSVRSSRAGDRYRPHGHRPNRTPTRESRGDRYAGAARARPRPVGTSIRKGRTSNLGRMIARHHLSRPAPAADVGPVARHSKLAARLVRHMARGPRSSDK